MPELRPGDIFCTVNPMMLGRAIVAIEATWAADRAAEYSHAGIILGPNATTFEARWTNGRYGLFSGFAGRKVVIARNVDMTPDRFMDGWRNVEHLEGRWYAGHRLILHILPPLARLGTGDFAVCSELTAKFLCGARLSDFWMGVNPDWIADLLHMPHKGWQIVWEDILPATLDEFRGSGPAASPMKEVAPCLSCAACSGARGESRPIQTMRPEPRRSDGVRRRRRGSAARPTVFSVVASPTPATWAS